MITIYSIEIILSVILLTLFLGFFIYKTKRLPESISALVYELPENKQWLWSAWLFTIGVCLFSPLVVYFGALGWWLEVCLLGTVLTPLINKDTRVWHYILGIVLCIVS